MTAQTSDAKRNSLVIVLHAHLPECRQPAARASLEETWFFEALYECYLPLIQCLDRLREDWVTSRITLSLSPTVLSMLQDEALLDRFRERLEAIIALADNDSTHESSELSVAAQWHADFLRGILRTFDSRCHRDPLGAFRQLHALGILELGTTAATHAFLPAHQSNPPAIRAQIGVGLDAFENAFGFRPDFFWLPECAFFPGLDDVLANLGVRIVGLESHGIRQAKPPPPHGIRNIVRSPGNGLYSLGRDDKISRAVWSASEGYPGDPHYREFYRDRVHEISTGSLPASFDGKHLPAGLKYWRVTGQTEDKLIYLREAALDRTKEHARDFVERLTRDSDSFGEDGVWFAPFDAELFGHWWFEGPQWLEAVLRRVADSPMFDAVTASEAIRCHGAHEALPAASTWGQFGDNSFWINRSTAWIYPQLNLAAGRLSALMPAISGSLQTRAARHAARLLLLAQSSDWPFLIKAGVSVEAATKKLTTLLNEFDRLASDLDTGAIDKNALSQSETDHPTFPSLDLKWFR